MSDSLPDGLDERRLEPLYRSPLPEFVARRNELAVELAKERPELAAWVRALRKPPVTAWAVNQLAWEHPQQLAKLRAAGDALRAAHARGEAKAMERAVEARRDALETLVTAAEALLGEAGHRLSKPALRKIHRTLEAIAACGSAHDLEPPPGRLQADLEPPGFDVLLGAPIAKPRSVPSAPRASAQRPGAKRSQRRPEDSRDARHHARLEKLVRAATAALEEYEASREARRAATVELERARTRERDAERALARIKERMERARHDLAEAVRERRAQERDVTRAERELERKRAALERARERLGALQRQR